MKRQRLYIVIFLALIIIVAGCTMVFQKNGMPSEEPAGADTGNTPGDDVAEDGNDNNGDNPADSEKDIDLADIKPNEAGKIMILMYHVIGEKEGEWSRTWENFKKDLGVLYEKGYRLISLNDYLDNNIKVEAGYTPVVITFDDATQGQFNILEEDGKLTVDPTSAVGILEEFYDKHPDFGLEATFYIYYPVPFRKKELIEYKLNYIVEKGMDIGNHTYGHANLGTLDAEGIQQQLGRMVLETQKIIPGYNISSLALPYGANAKEQFRSYVYSGSYQGVSYENKGVLLVGSNPALSPIDRKFDPHKIPRIRATEDPNINTDMYDWMDYFDKNPQERYVSDGDETVISVPKSMEDRIDAERLGDKRLRVYELDQ
ncbi:MAG: Polysaccharide deacetylase [Firmicutes bacterium]|nr:Polysaccharide deacetylase [Bacillota bacterium]MDI6706511.1 polysaccharide deacetylase family protein [Bacillota bacterium]